jgi:tRNA U34 5-carboxymethylaminomethyl modifying enzyme MnmG/GidA
LAGLDAFPAGRYDESASTGLAVSLKRDAGLRISRLKTGTPARLARSSIDFDFPGFIPAVGDKDPEPFSYLHDAVDRPVCWIGGTLLIVLADAQTIGRSNRLLHDANDGEDAWSH